MITSLFCLSVRQKLC